MEYGTPSTPEEIAACESSRSGVICVLRDLGSKFGELLGSYCSICHYLIVFYQY